jgi:hypothetical protein
MPSIFGQTTFTEPQKTAMGLPIAYSHAQVISFLNGYRGLFLETGISPFLDDEVELTDELSSNNGCYNTEFPINSITEIKPVDCGVVGEVIKPLPCFDKYSKSICLNSNNQNQCQCNHVTPYSSFNCNCDECLEALKVKKQIQITYKTGFTDSDNNLLMMALRTLPVTIVNNSIGSRKSHKSDDSETTYYEPKDSTVQNTRNKQLSIIKSIFAKYIPKEKSKISFA